MWSIEDTELDFNRRLLVGIIPVRSVVFFYTDSVSPTHLSSHFQIIVMKSIIDAIKVSNSPCDLGSCSQELVKFSLCTGLLREIRNFFEFVCMIQRSLPTEFELLANIPDPILRYSVLRSGLKLVRSIRARTHETNLETV